MTVSRFPISPVIGCIRVAGDATHPAFIQLLNNNVSKKLYVYELRVAEGAADIPVDFTIRMRRVTSPLNIGSSAGLKTANPGRLVQTDTTSINGLLRGCPDLGSIITEANAQWSGAPKASGIAEWSPTNIRDSITFPLVVKPNSALEFSSDSNGTDRSFRVYCTWDEELDNSASRPVGLISPIYGKVRTGGSVNGCPVIQLKNPVGSGVNLRVYEFGIEGGGPSQPSAGAMNSIKRLTTPFTLGGGGVETIANAFRLDKSDATVIKGILHGMDFTTGGINPVIAEMGDETKAQWVGLPARPTTDHKAPHYARRPPFAFYWTVSPGSCLAMAYLVQGAGGELRGYAVWDEVAI